MRTRIPPTENALNADTALPPSSDVMQGNSHKRHKKYKNVIFVPFVAIPLPVYAINWRRTYCRMPPCW